MFDRLTTLVIGAGASCELDFPSGAGLISQIIEFLNRDNRNAFGFSNFDIIDDLQAIAQANGTSPQKTSTPFLHAADAILEGLFWSRSIDNFLFTHRDKEQLVSLGKAAIANRILKAEFESSLMTGDSRMSAQRHARQPTLKDANFRKSWFVPFLRLLMSQVVWSEFAQSLKNVRFVIFNYDRSVEQALYMAVQEHFGVSAELAAESLREVQFLHPYGDLGILPWQSSNDESVPFGGGITRPNSFEIGKKLQTFTESIDSLRVAEVRKAVAEAETLIFLGFGYLQQNLQLITSGKHNASKVLATTYGISPADYPTVRNALEVYFRRRLPGQMPELVNGSCVRLFDDYSITLSLR